MAPFQFTASGNARRSFQSFSGKRKLFPNYLGKKRIGAAFEDLVPGDGAYGGNYPRVATVFRVIQVAPIKEVEAL